MPSENEIDKRPDDKARPPYGYQETKRQQEIQDTAWLDGRPSPRYRDSIIIPTDIDSFDGKEFIAVDEPAIDPDAGGNPQEIELIPPSDQNDQP